MAAEENGSPHQALHQALDQLATVMSLHAIAPAFVLEAMLARDTPKRRFKLVSVGFFLGEACTVEELGFLQQAIVMGRSSHPGERDVFLKRLREYAAALDMSDEEIVAEVRHSARAIAAGDDTWAWVIHVNRITKLLEELHGKPIDHPDFRLKGT